MLASLNCLIDLVFMFVFRPFFGEYDLTINVTNSKPRAVNKNFTILKCAVIKTLQCPQKLARLVLCALTLSNIDRFSNLSHCHNQENICNNTVIKDPITPQVRRYTIPCEMSVS